MQNARTNETYELIAAARGGDRLAKERLLCENSRLIYSIARRYLNRGSGLEDLYQLGAIGLIKAIDNFNEDYGVCFSTYAVPLIMGEIKRFLRDDGMIKVSRTQKTLAVKLCALREKITKGTGREPGIAELAGKAGVSAEEAAAALETVRPVGSLFEPCAEDERLLLIDKVSGGADTENDMINKVALRQLIAGLPERERRIIVMRYYMDKTQCQTGKLLGISQVQVSRIEKRVLSLLRAELG